MAVPRNDLGRNRLHDKAHGLGDMRLDARVDIGERADGSGEGASRYFLPGRCHPLPGAGELRICIGELKTESGGFSVDAMAAPDAKRILVLEGAALESIQQFIEVAQQNVRGADQLYVKRGVENVGRGHALVEKARLRTDDLGEVGEKSNDVMLYFALDCIDAIGIKIRLITLLPNRLGGGFGYGAEVCHRISGVRLDFEPDAVTRLRLP